MNFKKYLFVGFLACVLLVSPVLAETTDKDALIAELRAQVMQLQSQIAALTQRVAELTGGTKCNVAFSRALAVGSTGRDVVELQKFLMAKGFLITDDGQATGYFGPLTNTAISKYQAAVGISENGFGPLTRANLNSVLGCSSKNPSIVASKNRINSGETVEFVTVLPEGASYGGFEYRCDSSIFSISARGLSECNKVTKFTPKVGEKFTWAPNITLKNYLSSQWAKFGGEVYAYDASGNIIGKDIVWIEVGPKTGTQASITRASAKAANEGEIFAGEQVYVSGTNLSGLTTVYMSPFTSPITISSNTGSTVVFTAPKGLDTGNYHLQLVGKAIETNSLPVTVRGSSPAVAVVSPNGGETILAGSTITVKWVSGNIPTSALMTATLINERGSDFALFANEPNDGSATIKLNANTIPAGKYKLKINGEERAWGSDSSDSYFTITSGVVNTCANAPYQVKNSSGNCVWSCGEGTVPNNATGECVCDSGKQENGVDSYGRRTCGVASSEIVATSKPTVTTACENGVSVAKISWTGNPDPVSGKFAVDIDEGTYVTGPIWNRALTETSVTAPSGFGPAYGETRPLVFEGGKTYAVRTWNGAHSQATTFTAKTCQAATPNLPAQALTHEYLQFDTCGSDQVMGSYVDPKSGRTVYDCNRSASLKAGGSYILDSKLQFDNCPSGYTQSSWVDNADNTRRMYHCVRRGAPQDGAQVVIAGALQKGSCPSGYAQTSYYDHPEGRIFHCTKREIVKMGSAKASSWTASIFDGLRGLFVR